MMKKTLSLLLAGLLLTGTLASCKSKTPADTTVGSNTQTPDGATGEIDTSPVEEVTYYRNPIFSSKEEGFGLGDPFVMRYNGMYYMYITGTGVKCWSSYDLVNWKYEGTTTKSAVTKDAYAPEVFYYNGYFYMYTSPAGNGHYVLRSDSPTGPFVEITGNMGMSIDGSVFIDNDGKWYFYTSGGNAIQSYTMSSPSQMTFRGELSATSMNGWTEGPMVVYHDGYYYITYTGNHFMSSSYRINYASSSRSPVNFSKEGENPLLINTDGTMHHIGHNSTVKGPDLDSYYIVYHSMNDDGYNRDVNIDRIVFNGASMEIMGPTTSKQQVPSLPDVYAYFRAGDSLDGWTLNGSFGSGTGLPLAAGSKLISDYRFEGNYTAEYNVASIASGGKAGAIFSYTDENNYGSVLFDPASQKVIITFTVNGKSTVQEADMVQSFKEDVKFDCIQTIQVEKKGAAYTFYMNDHELCRIENSLPSGGIGYMTEGADASFGFIGGTAAVGGQGASDEYKTISKQNGLIPATTYTAGSYQTEKKSNVNAVVAKEGNVLNYRVYAAQNGTYDLAAEYFTADDQKSAVMEIYIDGTSAGEVNLGGSKSFSTAILRNIPITLGEHTVSFRLKSGDANFSAFTLQQSEEVKTLELDYSKSTDNHKYSDGSWKVQGGALLLSGNPSTGKRLYGDNNWGDYTLEAEVTPQNGVNCGLLVRATNPGATNYSENQPTDSDANNGTDWVEGYYVGLTTSGVILARQSYGYEQVESKKSPCKAGTTYSLKVVCEGASIKVYLDGELMIDYTDSDPFIQGMVGVRTYNCSAAFDNLKVTKLG